MTTMSVCARCRGLVERKKTKEDGSASIVVMKQEVPYCTSCLGLFSDSFASRLAESVVVALEPYGGAAANWLASATTTSTAKSGDSNITRGGTDIVLPGDLVYRFNLLQQQEQSASHTSETMQRASVVEFAEIAKRHGRSVLVSILDKLHKQKSSSTPKAAATTTATGNGDTNKGFPPKCVMREEQGHVSIHVYAVPKPHIARPVHQFPNTAKRGRRRRLPQGAESQGGDPRMILAQRLHEEKGIRIWSMNQSLTDTLATKPLDDDSNDNSGKQPQSALNGNDDDCQLDFFVAVWRRPFYLQSCYTKLRRDVSQTPFIVVDDGKHRRLGVSSVEEQILPIVTKYCGGLSTANKNESSSSNDDASSSGVVFAMAKFHASGREDMDVRMLLPPPDIVSSPPKDTNAVVIKGRPFVLQITDALRLPTLDDLNSMVHEINQTKKESDDDNTDGNDNLSPLPRSYGRNEMTSIDPNLKFVPGNAFKTLQADTEDKVKHYGCMCWSQNVLPPDDSSLNARLGTFPLDIAQRTPMRVLHRRSNMVRQRRVLAARAFRVDEHYFRLHISTTAGTYVKEFVHGDLGRSIPSISSILGCKTDILELDCEGIQMS